MTRFSAGTEGIVARIRGDIWKSRGRDMFRLFAHQADKRIPFDPVAEQFGLGILGAISGDLTPAILLPGRMYRQRL